MGRELGDRVLIRPSVTDTHKRHCIEDLPRLAECKIQEGCGDDDCNTMGPTRHRREKGIGCLLSVHFAIIVSANYI